MKSLVLSLMFLVLSASIVTAATATPAGQVRGLYDEEELTGTPAATATPAARIVRTLDVSDAPESGTTENTIILLSLGIVLIITGVKINERFS